MKRQTRNIFKCKNTNKAFLDWIKVFGATYHPSDVIRFYDFAVVYYRNREDVSKKAFVKECKKYTHTTQRENRGICQKYYEKLFTIVEFLKKKGNILSL